MNPSFRPSWRLAALALALALAQPAPAARAAAGSESQEAKSKLAAVRARIADLARKRAGELAERDVLAARLRDAELEVTRKRQSLEELQSAAAQAAERRGELQVQRQRARSTLDGERSRLAAEIRMAAMLGPQQELRLLLNQTDARRMGRMLTMEAYFGRAQAAGIAGSTPSLPSSRACRSRSMRSPRATRRSRPTSAGNWTHCFRPGRPGRRCSRRSPAGCRARTLSWPG